MGRSGVWRMETSLYEYALLTSRPDERAEISRLETEKGGLVEGITEWVKRKKSTWE
jgi:hypothetical protein